MGYEAREHDGTKCREGDSGFDVVNVESGEARAHHADKPTAERQVRVLTEMEKEEE